MNKDIIDKIKSRGYWRINFQPLVYERKLKLGDCKDIVEKNDVELRGWNYPHFPRRVGDDTGLEPGENFYGGWVDWFNHIEFWRMYESGQFLHYLALREDWGEAGNWAGIRGTEIKPGTLIGITGSITYQLTEIYEFLSRLTRAGVYDTGVRVSISLNNTKGRKLWIEDPMRAGFLMDYKTGAERIEFTEQYTKEDLLMKPKDLAFDIIIYICDHFGWHKPSVDVIKKDQDALLNMRI